MLRALRHLALVGAALAPTSHALAQSSEAPDAASAPPVTPWERGYDLEVGFRARPMALPTSIMDIWFFNPVEQGWADGDRPRPTVAGLGLGMEFVVRNDTSNGIFYVEYVRSSMKPGYWDDREEPPDRLDGDFIVPSEGLGLVTLGADYAYEIHLVRTEQTSGAFGMSFLVGGGLGVGFLLGDLGRWGPSGGVPAFDRYDACVAELGEAACVEGDESFTSVPPVLPMVDLNAGVRFNIADRVTLRLEAGLHTLFYYGASVGVVF